MSIVCAEESFEKVWGEMEGLFGAHYQEVSHNPDIPLAPDNDRYEMLARNGRLRIYTVRSDSQLIGYAVFIVATGLHYSGSLQAKQDILFVDPSSRGRGAGIKLLRFADAALAAEGVQVVYHHVKLAHPALGRLLEHLGYEPVETVYSRRLDL